MELIDERDSFSRIYHHEGGISDFTSYLNKNKEVLHPVLYFSGSKDDVQVEVSLQYNDGYNENIHSYVNNIRTQEGGTHELGFKVALTRLVNDYARRLNMLKENDANLAGEDIREGMTAVISVKVPEPQFEGQTKTKLGNTEVRGIVDTVVGEGLGTFLEENPTMARRVIDKTVKAARAREAARKARELTRNLMRWKKLPCLANWPIVPLKTQAFPNYTWWKATPPAVLPSKAEIGGRKRFCLAGQDPQCGKSPAGQDSHQRRDQEYDHRHGHWDRR